MTTRRSRSMLLRNASSKEIALSVWGCWYRGEGAWSEAGWCRVGYIPDLDILSLLHVMLGWEPFWLYPQLLEEARLPTDQLTLLMSIEASLAYPSKWAKTCKDAISVLFGRVPASSVSLRSGLSSTVFWNDTDLAAYCPCMVRVVVHFHCPSLDGPVRYYLPSDSQFLLLRGAARTQIWALSRLHDAIPLTMHEHLGCSSGLEPRRTRGLGCHSW